MPTVRSTLEAGTAGAAITTTNSGGGPYGDDAFDAVTVGSSSEAVFDDAANRVAYGALAARFSVAAGEESFVGYSTKLGTLTQVWGRAAVVFGTIPQGAGLRWLRTRNGNAHATGALLRTDGKLAIVSASGSQVVVSTSVVPANTKVWFEWKIQFGTTGSFVLRYYDSLSATTPTETLTASGYDANTQGTRFELGITARGTASPAYGSLWVDVIDWNTTGFPGPFRDSISPSSVASGEAVGSPSLALSGGAPGTLYEFRPGGQHGGGFQNTGDVDPFTSGRVISGADVAGFQVSEDAGGSWRARNLGMVARADGSVAAVAFSGAKAGVCYAVTGNGSQSAASFWRSTDGGITWQRRASGSAAPNCRGGSNSAYPGLPGSSDDKEHPRSVGRLIAIDERDPDNPVLYVGSHHDGVYRSTDGGANWTSIGMQDRTGTRFYIRTILLSPADADDLLVGTYEVSAYPGTGGLWRIPNARTRTSATDGTRLGAGQSLAPTTVEDAIALGQRVYCACGDEGIRRYNFNTGNWADLTAALDRAVRWCAIDGYGTSPNVTLYVGNAQPESVVDATGARVYKSIARTTDEGGSWSWLTTDSTKVHNEMGGPGGDPWWHFSSARLGAGTSVVSQLRVDPTHTSRIYSFGRAGVWRSDNSGADWYPAMRHLEVTIGHPIVADPNVGGRVYLGSTDWFFFASADSLETLTNRRPSGPGVSLTVAVDGSVTPAVVYAGQGTRGDKTNTGGEIRKMNDPVNSSTIVSEDLGSATTAAFGADRRVLGVAVRRVSGEPVIIACVEDGGIWRKAGGSWTNVLARTQAFNGTVSPKAQAYIVWMHAPHVYVYDRDTGIWRSANNGQTWTRIWAVGTSGLGGFREFSTVLAGDPTTPGRLYLSNANGLSRIDDARTGTVGSGITPVDLGLSDPGAVTVDTLGRVYVHRIPTRSRPSALLRSADLGQTWTELSDGLYRDQAMYTTAISVGLDAKIYVTTAGMGQLVGEPRSASSQTISPGTVAGEQVVSAVRLTRGTPPPQTASPASVASGETVGEPALVLTEGPGLAYFLPPAAGERLVLPRAMEDPDVPRSWRYLAYLADQHGGGVGGELEVGGHRYARGRWNGPLSGQEVSAITAAGYADRVVYISDPSELPGDV